MFAKSTHLYQRVSEKETNDHKLHFARKLSKNLRGNLRYIILGITLSMTIVVTTIVIKSHRERHPLWSSCGSTPEVARQRMCSFDLISFAWQMPECYDSTLISDFATWDEWLFYTEMYGNVTVPQNIVLVGEQSLWVTWRYHIVHCTFMWRQMQRAYERGWIDTHLHAYNHTLHCQSTLLERGIEDTEVITYAKVIYPACERVRKGTGIDS